MTKLEFAGEPSMEDILASIRRMISEEPSGPRPVPDKIGRTDFAAGPPETQQIANEPQQGGAEQSITRLLNGHSGPAQGGGTTSTPLAAFSERRDDPSHTPDPGRARAFNKPSPHANDTTLPFGRRAPEPGPNLSDRTGLPEASVGGAEPFASNAAGAVSEKRSAPSLSDTTANKPAAARVSSLVANLEKARANAAAEVRSKKEDEGPVADVPAPEAVAAALLDESGMRLSKADSSSSGANGATISPFSTPAEERAPKSEASGAVSSLGGAPEETSNQSIRRPGAASLNALNSGALGDAALRLSQEADAHASAPTSPKLGGAGPPSEALLDAVVDLVKKEPSSLSVFTSGSAFIHGVADGANPGKPVSPPRKLDMAASELLRPMLRQWLSENMPRIVEEALRSELNSSQTTEEDTPKA